MSASILEQFIDAATREFRRITGPRCPWRPSAATSDCGRENDGLSAWCEEHHRYLVVDIAREQWPPHVARCREALWRDVQVVCIWTGHIEALNGCSIEEIVRLAEEAETRVCITCEDRDDDPSLPPHRFDLPAFATALVSEGRARAAGARGASVYTFRVPICLWCECTSAHDREPSEGAGATYCRNGFHDCRDYEPTPFLVPPLSLTREVPG